MSFNHFTYKDRIRIETMYNIKVPVIRIAEELNCSRSAIYYELKKGLYTALNTEYRNVVRYSADRAHARTKFNEASKGVPVKLGNDNKFASYCIKMIKKGHSPYCILENIKQKNLQFDTQICLSTFYNYVRRGLFLNITMKDMVYGNYKKKKDNIIERYNLNHIGKSIEERHDDINKRESFGHWEIDSIIGAANTSGRLVSMVERKTRYALLYYVTNGKAENVVSVLNNLSERLGKSFNEVLRSITADNGREFYYLHESSVPEIYFCHPYCASERGSNENYNRVVRRYIKKSTDISKYTTDYIKKVENRINNMPRRIFGGKSAAQRFLEECQNIS